MEEPPGQGFGRFTTEALPPPLAGDDSAGKPASTFTATQKKRMRKKERDLAEDSHPSLRRAEVLDPKYAERMRAATVGGIDPKKAKAAADAWIKKL